MKTDLIGDLSDTYDHLTNAVICPPDSENLCGVLRDDGSFCQFSRAYLGARRVSGQPKQMPEKVHHLPGRHLFAGWMRPHFGHFLLESTPRLWALDALSDSVESIVFTPFHRGGARKARDRYKPFLDIITGGKPLQILARPTRVDELIVPDPGFGHGERVLGSPRYRSFFRDQVAKEIPPKGAERLYISRSELWGQRGGVFGETRVEALMKANGYTIFHPQNHSAVEQLAHYRAAREIVCLDGSALHMAAYALQPGARIGMILRRHARVLDGLVRQLEVFADATVYQLDALRNSWVDEKARRVDFRSVGELDFSRLQKLLQDAGFIEERANAENLTQSEITAIISEMGRGPMRAIPVDTARL